MNASEVMSHNPIAVPAEAGLAEALTLMFDHHVSGLPVVEGKTRLVGILTEGDLQRESLREPGLGRHGNRVVAHHLASIHCIVLRSWSAQQMPSARRHPSICVNSPVSRML